MYKEVKKKFLVGGPARIGNDFRRVNEAGNIARRE
jgi:hypothetical protein